LATLSEDKAPLIRSSLRSVHSHSKKIISWCLQKIQWGWWTMGSLSSSKLHRFLKATGLDLSEHKNTFEPRGEARFILLPTSIISDSINISPAFDYQLWHTLVYPLLPFLLWLAHLPHSLIINSGPLNFLHRLG
jgi:hypothetical protein